jgi:hypothetical protein
MCTSERLGSLISRIRRSTSSGHHQVGAVLAWLGRECTELARVDADVRVVDVQVDVEEGPLAVHAPPHAIGQRAHRPDLRVLVERHSVLEGQPLTSVDLPANLAETGRIDQDVVDGELRRQFVRMLLQGHAVASAVSWTG